MVRRVKTAGDLPQVHRMRLTLEPLEPRLLLSGTVTAFVSGGDLFLTGDLLDNDVSITQGVTPDEFIITGNNLTTVNGAASETLGGVYGDILVEMGDGYDTVEFTNAAAPGDLAVNGGAGPLNLFIGLGGTTGVAGDLILTAGDGADQFVIDTVDVAGGIRIDQGDGLNVVALDDTTVGGDLLVTNGNGHDVLSVELAYVGGRMDLRTRDGGATIGVGGATVGKDLVIVNGEGSESVSITDTEVAGSVKIDNGLGSGDHVTDIAGIGARTTIGKDLVIKSKDGYDLVTVRNVDVAGSATIDLGLEGGSVNMSYGGTDVNVTKDVVVKNKTGPLGFYASNLALGGSLKVDNGSGSADVSVGAVGNVTTGKDFMLESKSGSVTGFVTNLTTTGSLKATFGADSTLVIEPSQIGKNLQVKATGGADIGLILQVRTTNLEVKATGGGVFLSALECEVLGKTKIQGGLDYNAVRIYDSTFWGDVAIKLGSAGDTVDIETATWAVAAITEFKGLLKVDTGGGDDTITVGKPADAFNSIIAIGLATFNGGAGLNDTLDVEGHGNVFASGKIVTNIENLPL